MFSAGLLLFQDLFELLLLVSFFWTQLLIGSIHIISSLDVDILQNVVEDVMVAVPDRRVSRYHQKIQHLPLCIRRENCRLFWGDHRPLSKAKQSLSYCLEYIDNSLKDV